LNREDVSRPFPFKPMYNKAKNVEYLHRDPASRRSRRKGSLKSESVKYGHESQETQTKERLRWRGPAAYTKKQTGPLAREGAPENQDP
jgi:hypothetical protein